MIRLALPKGRNLETALAAFAAGGLDLTALASDATRDSRRLWHSFPELGCEVLLLKDRDLPLYVGRGVVDCGIVGRDDRPRGHRPRRSPRSRVQARRSRCHPRRATNGRT